MQTIHRVAKALGWFSLGPGLSELLFGKNLDRYLGTGGRDNTLRLFGLREIAAGAIILAQKEPSAASVWSRVGGDVMDLIFLGKALEKQRNPTRRERPEVATATVAAVMALDVFCAWRLGRNSGSDEAASASTRATNGTSLVQPGWRESHRAVNGVNLHVVEAGPEDGPLLVLLHGFPEFWWGWRHQIGPFAQAGYHVVVPDMRGYNTSDIPPEVSNYHLDTLTADVVALADSFGAERFDLVAHDWGAVISWWVVAHHPERIKRAVLMDGPHPDVWAAQALRHPTQALRSTYVAAYQLPWLPEATLGAWDFAALRKFMEVTGRRDTFEPGSLDCYVEAWSHPGSLTAMLNYYRALRERESGKEPARLAPPTLVLWAENDSFLNRSVAEAGVALCDQGRLEIVPGTTHWLHLEEPEWINATILRFLANGAN